MDAKNSDKRCDFDKELPWNSNELKIRENKRKNIANDDR